MDNEMLLIPTLFGDSNSNSCNFFISRSRYSSSPSPNIHVSEKTLFISGSLVQYLCSGKLSQVLC